MEISEKIISTALELFLNNGIKTITMDTIAKQASISKKTIYVHFKDKNHLVLNVTKKRLQNDYLFFGALGQNSENAIAEIFKIGDYLRAHLVKMNPNLLYDLKKYHHESWEYYNFHKVECFENSIIKNINRGKKEGLYRNEINEKILSRLRMIELETSFDNTYYPSKDFKFEEIHLELFKHFVMGLITPKGLSLYNQYLN